VIEDKNLRFLAFRMPSQYLQARIPIDAECLYVMKSTENPSEPMDSPELASFLLPR
jgi:hypothetical protein